MTNQTAPTCEALRIFRDYQQAILDYESASGAIDDTDVSRSLIDGVCANVIVRDLEKDAFDRIALHERALSFAKCSSVEGALALFATAARISTDAVECNLDPITPEDLGSWHQGLNIRAYSEHERRADRMKLSALRFLMDNGFAELGRQMLTVLAVPEGKLTRAPIETYADFEQALAASSAA